MKIATWNVNSLKSRLDHMKKWVKEFDPDVILLQEIKCQTDAFPALEVQALGYHTAIYGQKAYNGVAILAKEKIENVSTGLPHFEDDQARYIEGTVNGIRLASIYVPNGASLESDKFRYKMAFFQKLSEYLTEKLLEESPYLVGGDFNVAFDEKDVYDPAHYKNKIHFSFEERHALRALINMGYNDTYRVFESAAQQFSWWDYRAGSWQQDKGLRIDYIFSNPQATDKLSRAGIDRTPRGWEKPSDHTPVWCTITP